MYAEKIKEKQNGKIGEEERVNAGMRKEIFSDVTVIMSLKSLTNPVHGTVDVDEREKDKGREKKRKEVFNAVNVILI